MTDILKALNNPSNELVEAWSRSCLPLIWRRIDEHKADDDWNGGAALNLRRAILREDKQAIIKLALAIEITTVMDEPLSAKTEDLVTIRGNKVL
jgi:hypothetical protein